MVLKKIKKLPNSGYMPNIDKSTGTQPFTEIIETNAKNGLVPLATSLVN